MITVGYNVTTEEEKADGTDDGYFGIAHALEKVVVSCTQDELAEFLRFLRKTRLVCSGYESFCSEQWRDWKPGWTEDECDIEVMFNIGIPAEKEER